MAAINWRRRTDHFDWLTAYLQARGMTRPIRWVMGAIGLSLGLIPVEAMLVPPERPEWAVSSLYWVLGVGGLCSGGWWLARWPTRNQSVVLAIVGSMTMAAWALVQPDPLLSLLACASLVISGGYLALFHSPPYVLYNVLLAGGVAFQAAWRLWTSGNEVHAVLAFWLVLVLNVVGPLAVLVFIDAFGIDLPHADRDPLTGLLNRRGLGAYLAAVLETADANAHLCATVIDIDDFKRVNDTHGHGVGDDVLTAVADIVREHVDEAAAACRNGGEEFLIVATTSSDDVPHYADVIRSRIAALPIEITVSVGTSRARLLGADPERIDGVIAAADAAMYEAKRLGGNRVRHMPPIVPPHRD